MVQGMKEFAVVLCAAYCDLEADVFAYQHLSCSRRPNPQPYMLNP